jgi:hypothetical protein
MRTTSQPRAWLFPSEPISFPWRREPADHRPGAPPSSPNSARREVASGPSRFTAGNANAIPSRGCNDAALLHRLDPPPRTGKSKLATILYRWSLVCNPLQLSRGQVCQVSAPGLFSAHAGAHAAGDPSLCVSQSLGVSQFGPALCAAHRLSGRRDEYDAFQYDELPAKHCILVSHRCQRWRKYVV